jgi:hypothetical protein
MFLAASPGASSLRCLCASVGPGPAKAQADDLPMHLMAEFWFKADSSHVLFRVRALGRSQGPFCRLFLFVWPAQAQAAYAANVPQWAMAMPRRRLRDYLCT